MSEKSQTISLEIDVLKEFFMKMSIFGTSNVKRHQHAHNLSSKCQDMKNSSCLLFSGSHYSPRNVYRRPRYTFCVVGNGNVSMKFLRRSILCQADVILSVLAWRSVVRMQSWKGRKLTQRKRRGESGESKSFLHPNSVRSLKWSLEGGREGGSWGRRKEFSEIIKTGESCLKLHRFPLMDSLEWEGERELQSKSECWEPLLLLVGNDWWKPWKVKVISLASS